jgi:hypothetical protein
MTSDTFFSRATMMAARAIAIAVALAYPARAEFPPEGAVPDPNNASIATGDYPSPTRDGVALHTVFYFDCGTRNWVGVSVKVPSGVQNSPAEAAGPGRKYPPGPPTGSKRDATDPNRAYNKSTGQNFAFRDGNWIDTKTGKLLKAPKLCPDSGSTGGNALKQAGEQRRIQNQPVSPADDKPDHLPAAPEFIPGQLPTSRP